MERRTQLEDKDWQLERQCYDLNPERWEQVYKDRIFAQMGLGQEEGTPLTEDDLDELDTYMEEQERRFAQTLVGRNTMSGAQAQGEPEWGPWV